MRVQPAARSCPHHRVPTMHPFRTAIEARDIHAARALLADDVVFRSPVVFKPYQGAETTGAILTAVSQVFEDFVYETEYASAGPFGNHFMPQNPKRMRHIVN
jgi:hypothetical protein